MPRTSESNGYVTVGCNLPGGIILHVDDMVDSRDGLRDVKIARKRAERYTVNGIAKARAVGQLHKFGYATTDGIPADFWAAWLDQHKSDPLVTNHLVFAASSEHEVHAEARDYRGEKTGLEPIDPTGDPRMPRGQPNVGAVTAGSGKDE